ncbi:methionine adenosyltransferase [Candidatus Kuenenbacteria bacterium CG11_big_fil_rev_8_21_14_0_20_37_9]|uniref:S-adenosylmethionine synthase n=2 Tax=Candidatus Kueneniibacteriota TaxID=1752740 RepID=A0A2M6XSN7_9BACT|nr:MAG: methionine adenosyltransferase [Candidatus Kuenenbacteria bacterium CG1_02_38_13]PIR05552.1 MAG: methionine adenosyltransferase [Candidatus Kuenenbacteria bacterium CG11_big_fil_rev_8_21_14_0_20_37_9]PIU10657.1 MAG: methionine adenosyltransferase [Candidatus Kuenenbacteria bacterium CG08_land_8_20_14_0_20_37_23]
MLKHIFTSESVTEGHPDKIADQISDAILDELIRQDKFSHAGIETLLSTGLVVIAGQIRTKGYVDIAKIARQTIKEIGYNNGNIGFSADDCGVIVAIDEQSPDIAQGVDKNKGKYKKQGAGDQGLMFGYACRETRELMPLSILMSHKMAARLAAVRKNKTLPYLRPDGKIELAVEYENTKPKRLDTIVVAAQHNEKISLQKIQADIIKYVVKPVAGKYLDDKTKFFVNATGRFVKGGPPADTGLTGRKIIVDTYGGHGAHGGGCFSGKDPSKVDRSASYMARYIAKNMVAAGLADRCEIQIAYVIGVAEPVSVLVDTKGTGKINDEKLEKIVRQEFPLTPEGIINHLRLLRPIYKKTATYGHFGRELPEFTWEKKDKIAILKKYLR